MLLIKKKFEDTNEVVRIRKSKKDKQHRGQKKKDKQHRDQKKKDKQHRGQKKEDNNDLQNKHYTEN
jgi:hypothetical protein